MRSISNNRTLLSEEHDLGMKWLDRASLLSGKKKGRAFARVAKAAMLLRIAAVWGHQGPCVVVSPRWRSIPRSRKIRGGVFGGVWRAVGMGGREFSCAEDTVFVQGGEEDGFGHHRGDACSVE
jgi:hypothetical protein